MTKTIKVNDAKCPNCKNEFETTKSTNIQCFKCKKRFDL